MDELVKEMERFREATSAFTLTDVAIVLFLSFLLSTTTAAIYRFTHRGTSYSQSFAQTLVLMGMVTALIMLIIGSNIARAFSLVGALSVIRFRNAVKETRDVGYMFLVMALGMACGTRFYMLGIFACTVMSAVMVLMSKLDLFARKVVERLLRVRMAPGQDSEAALAPIFREHASDNRLVAVDALPDGTQEAVYTVVLKSNVQPEQFIEAIRAVNGNRRIVLVVGQQEVDL
ncbi:MAG: DUF4956 domain-containing protein [Deltaproteobacteria bacterium]|nr:DUF4956 domain-containing protein [Deltaproteobacteria bacterium]